MYEGSIQKVYGFSHVPQLVEHWNILLQYVLEDMNCVVCGILQKTFRHLRAPYGMGYIEMFNRITNNLTSPVIYAPLSQLLFT